MSKIAFIFLLVTLITGCDNKEETKNTIQSKKDTPACCKDKKTCKDIKFGTSEAKSPPMQTPNTLGQVSRQNIVSKNKEAQKAQAVVDTIRQLPIILFITTSQGCHCALARCSAGDSIVKKIVKSFPQALELKQIDYAKEKDSVENLAKKYQFSILPALIIFDGEGNFKCKLDSPFEEGLIQEKLKEVGVNTN